MTYLQKFIAVLLPLVVFGEIVEENCLLQMGKPTEGALDAEDTAAIAEAAATQATIDTVSSAGTAFSPVLTLAPTNIAIV